jgi:hypothetical protein
MSYAKALSKDMFRREDTDEMVFAAVSKDGMQLQYVKKQTPRLVYAALKQNWRALQYVDDLDNQLVRQAVLWDPRAASLLPPKFHQFAVIVDINCFDYILKPSMEVCRYVIEQRPDWIAKRPNPPLELCLTAVKARHIGSEEFYVNWTEYLGLGYFDGITVTEELAKASLPITNGWAYRSLPRE